MRVNVKESLKESVLCAVLELRVEKAIGEAGYTYDFNKFLLIKRTRKLPTYNDVIKMPIANLAKKKKREKSIVARNRM